MWIARLKDNTLINQKESKKLFSDISHLVIGLGFEYNGTVIFLPNNLLDYRYGGSASASLAGGEAKVDSYWIQGTFHSDFKKLRIRFYNNEKKIEVETD